MKQSQALDILKTGANVFLTGEPGSGKTYVVNRYIRYLWQHKVKAAVTASTGIAATHIGGITIHSWSGIGIRKKLSDREISYLQRKKRLVDRAKQTQVLIIDEISMLDSQTLSTVDLALKNLRKNPEPFGGLQVVFVGDFFQLPPISRRDEAPAQFAFESESWQAAKPAVCYLSEQHRQVDVEFSRLLRSVRTGESLIETHTILAEKHVTEINDTHRTRLYSHNADVDELNGVRLARLETPSERFTMQSKGRKALVEQLKKGCLSPEELVLKKGARVMFTKNNFDVGYVNGTLGEVVDFRNAVPVVKTTDGETIEVEAMDWVIEEDGKVLASITQIPLRLAWAITVHKSQGMTLDEAVVDLSAAFEYGQGYVAISRVKSLSGLQLLGLNKKALEVHPNITEVDQEFKNLSNRAVKALDYYSDEEIEVKQKAFIDRVGGTWVKKKKKSFKGSTYEKTLKLYQEGLSIEAIAKERELTTKTIVRHLEKLRQEEKVTVSELKRVVPKKLKKDLPKIQMVFSKQETPHLSPVFNYFNGKYSYDQLRLIRLLIE